MTRIPNLKDRQQVKEFFDLWNKKAHSDRYNWKELKKIKGIVYY